MSNYSELLQELKFQVQAFDDGVINAEDFSQAMREIYEKYKM